MTQIDIDDVKDTINQAAGEDIAYNLQEEDPTKIKNWVSTGCFLLDAITARGEKGGVPSGKIIELAGKQSTGKSFLSSMIASNAQEEMGTVVYFDSEEAMGSDFLEKIGVNLDNIVYAKAKSVELVFEVVEQVLGDFEDVLFVWDSIALTPVEALKESDHGQRQDISAKARILANEFQRMTVPLGETNSTLICTNQLRDYIPKKHESPNIKYTKPYYTPGGKTANHAYSLRIWLTRRGANSAYVTEEGEKIGAEVEAEVRKSRFGSEQLTCKFDLIWSGDIGISEKEYWIEFLEETDHLEQGGAWYTFTDGDYEKKVQGSAKFKQALDEDDEFEARVKKVLNNKLNSQSG